LSDFFVERYNFRFRKGIKGIVPEALDLLNKYDWPGNVRELKNAIERAMILEDTDYIRPTYLPIQVTGAPPGFEAASEIPPYAVDIGADGGDGTGIKWRPWTRVG